MSFGHDGGGTLTLPSPTHPNHIDVQAAVRTLRRSISRSPSKFPLSRAASQNSTSSGSSPRSRNSPSPASPSPRRMVSQQFGTSQGSHLHAPTTHSLLAQAPQLTPFRPSKLTLRSAKSTSKLFAAAARSPSPSAPKSAFRSRTSPRSPCKRPLHTAPPTAGNSTPTPYDSDASGQENTNLFNPRILAPHKSAERTRNRHSMHLDMSGVSLGGSISSPLKRSDATMNLEQTRFGSPKAKRRSFGPSTLAGNDLSVFNQGSASPGFDVHDETNREYDWSSDQNTSDPLSSPTPLAMPRKTGSLRRSTLQQRHTGERASISLGRRHGAQQLSLFSNDASTPGPKNRPRLSLDHYLPPPQRESPFGSPSPLPNPSAHVVNQQSHQPHPLSRTVTTSSSNSSLPDESPTHFPVQISDKPRAPMNFSKSLPVGAVRPTAEGESRSIGSVSTPDYKSAKPFSGAFASTGLVSKMNKYPELEPIGRGGIAVPDTPCKKQVNGFATYPPLPISQVKPRGSHIKHTFGTPSTPFNSMATRSQLQSTFGEPVSRPGLFTAQRHVRRGSLLSLYSDDGQSGLDNPGDSQMTDSDIPPTPTKQQLLTESSYSSLSHASNDSPTANRHLPPPLSAFGSRTRQVESTESCKYSPPGGSSNSKPGEDVAFVFSDEASDSSSLVVLGTAAPISLSLPSFSRNRARRGSVSTPAPLEIMTASSQSTLKKDKFAKNVPMLPATPLDRLDLGREAPPQTPSEDVAPPDASRLSISNPSHGFLFPTSHGKRTSIPPATPTTRQDGLLLFQDRRAITPTNGLGPREVDPTLLKRFDKVEYVGKGEFSEVWKVSLMDRPPPSVQTNFFSTPVHRSPPSPSPDKVFAVKKLKLPLKGDNDRALRLREVTALKSLQGAEHVLQLVHSWEERNSIYIQTEYCEEGGLDVFLASVGIRGRLDDFRIWKIMLELTQGLQHIHDAGFVHLDLKPANILINFEGVLKIGDFGMATALPAGKGPDLEGDREYLAPEVLRGEIDKPADIFSLGLIMLEIAANVKLPENGATWTALREGDFSEIPPLTPDAGEVLRDVTGMPVDETDRSVSGLSDASSSSRHSFRNYTFRTSSRHSGDIFGLSKKNELQEPPDFMVDETHPSSLDSVVKHMLTPEPLYRPTVSQLLELYALHWVAARQRAGATVFEGNWGPSDELNDLISLDTEMTDI